MNRAQVIALRVDECIRQTPMKRRDFAARVRAHYEATVPPEHRSIDFSSREDAFDRMEADEEKVFGMLENTIRRRLPVELEEAVIAALPEERRLRLLMELGEREGLLIVPMPEGAKSVGARALGRLAKEAGEVFERFAPILEDGKVDVGDARYIPAAILDLNELISVAHEMRAGLLKYAPLAEGALVVPMRGRKR